MLNHDDIDRDTIYRGITAREYCQRYEQSHSRKIEQRDKILLSRITNNILFCEYCLKPFMIDNIENELTNSSVALLDFISAITFIIIPIVWIVLVVWFVCLTLIQFVMTSSVRRKSQSKS